MDLLFIFSPLQWRPSSLVGHRLGFRIGYGIQNRVCGCRYVLRVDRTNLGLCPNAERWDMNLKSDLGRVRGLGSAKEGTRHWWHQRLTAIALVPLTLWFVIAILARLNSSHTETIEWISFPLNTVLLIALLISTFYHTILGLQVVIEDYVHVEWTKVSLLILVKLGFSLCALASVVSILKIAFGMG